MIKDEPGKVIAIYIGESDHVGGKPLSAAIVERAREEGMVGATVARGIMGFGAHSKIHATRFELLSQDLPVVVTIIDTPDKVDAFLPVLHGMVKEGMVVTWDAHIELYRDGSD